jgi:competence protein ComEC
MKFGGQTGVLAGAAAQAARAAAWAPDWRAFVAASFAKEVDERRLFLWVPVAAMAGVCLNIAADREPALWLAAALALAAGALALALRHRRFAFAVCVGFCALFAGFFSMGFRTARVAAPVLDHIREQPRDPSAGGGRRSDLFSERLGIGCLD